VWTKVHTITSGGIEMKKLFCIMSLVFFALCLICGACYGGFVIMELVAKLKETKASAIEKLRIIIEDE